MGIGIDYGRGQANIDTETGIRFGVISQNAVLQAWADSSESHSTPHCPSCAEEIGEDLLADFKVTCPHCGAQFLDCDAWPDEPEYWYIDDGEYQAVSDDYGDIFITKSPYYTWAAYCSPCAPGACHLSSPNSDGERAYCFGHDWFDDGRAPYPVYRVSDYTEVLPEN